ncbi:multicomponent Na+:H+ antiporter subunit E [Neomicrococcus aestuarii]|uniref:Multicomponent Na+:H+ antiporter subunit E n=1 Tax=Neomicrococcus aestuarii TaxID=556325 RepID=A0A7W8TUQ9_9MICC|nr:Na+/H+ antiporter subunit E [Neomicrococcus aestuarii]MBB5513272.1 multicomponent Na+:H+ antiporter subunit E [Neomicrococcus aestuarii]
MTLRKMKKARDRSKLTLINELPLLVWLVFVWVVLWQNYSLGNIAFGLVLALIIVNYFRLPPVELSGRFNVWFAILFVFDFIKDIFVASFQLAWVALVRPTTVRNAVIGVPLQTRQDLIVTFVGHVTTLIPGSLVIDVDRRTSTLYLHVFDVRTEEDLEKMRRKVWRTERQVLSIMGTKEEYEAMKASAKKTLENKNTQENKPAAGKEVNS